MLEKFLTAIGAILVAGVIIFFVATLTGTILWAIYPHIHALFPTAAANHIIAQDLGWWDSVCITYIFSILLKGRSSSSSSDDKKKK